MAAPRASWKGQLKISLVSFPVCLYNATTSASRIGLNQLHKGCNLRLRQQMSCPEHGPVDRSDIIKGYEYERDRYVIVDEDDLDKISLETTKTVEIVQFVDEGEVPEIYFESPYYVAPDGLVAEEPFRVMREAMRKNRKVGIGRVVMHNREYVVGLRVLEKGFLLSTLRSKQEVKEAGPFFEGVRNGEVNKQQLDLAEQLIKMQAAPVDFSQFRDRYQDALLDLIKAKVAGTEPVVAPQPEVGPIINLMDALKQSIAQTAKKKPPAASVKSVGAKTRKAKGA